MKQDIKFSVIIPTNRADENTKLAIHSVLGQEHPAYEIIVIIDGVNGDILPKSSKIVYKKVNHSSPAKSRNEGIKIAKGDYIAFLDCDDYFPPYYLNYIYFKIRISEKKNLIIFPIKYPEKPFENSIYLGQNTGSIPNLVISNVEITPFDERLFHKEDHLFILENLKKKSFLSSTYNTIINRNEKSMTKNRRIKMIIRNNLLFLFIAREKRVNPGFSTEIIFLCRTILECGGVLLRKIGVWKK